MTRAQSTVQQCRTSNEVPKQTRPIPLCVYKNILGDHQSSSLLACLCTLSKIRIKIHFKYLTPLTKQRLQTAVLLLSAIKAPIFVWKCKSRCNRWTLKATKHSRAKERKKKNTTTKTQANVTCYTNNRKAICVLSSYGDERVNFFNGNKWRQHLKCSTGSPIQIL